MSTSSNAIIYGMKGQLDLKKLHETLSENFNPPNLCDAILDRIYCYYETQLHDPKNVGNIETNHIYDLFREIDESIQKYRDQRRINEPESKTKTEDESSLSSSSSNSSKLPSRRQIINRKDGTSSNLEDFCYEEERIESTPAIAPILLGPFPSEPSHQPTSLQGNIYYYVGK